MEFAVQSCNLITAPLQNTRAVRLNVNRPKESVARINGNNYRSEYSQIKHAVYTREIPFRNNYQLEHYYRIFEYVAHFEQSRRHRAECVQEPYFRVECVGNYKTNGNILGLLVEFPRVYEYHQRSLASATGHRVHAPCYTKRFQRARAQKPRVTQCVLTRDIVHWITLEKVPLILPRAMRAELLFLSREEQLALDKGEMLNVVNITIGK